MAKSFSEFKSGFYSRVNDLKLFDCGKYNLLKVVLDGLKVRYSSRGKIRVFIFLSFPVMKFYFFLLRLKSGNTFNVPAIPKRKYWIIDGGGRTIVNNGKPSSLYFSNIIEALGRDKTFITIEGGKAPLADHDVRIQTYDAKLIAGLGSLDKEEKALIVSLKETFERIKSSGIFSGEELKDISISFQQFFIQYRCWKYLLKENPPETVYLVAHYHREGVILASKEKGVKVIELQHGIISPKDIFYVFPEQVAAVEARALFADEIWVYGKFWKEQLLMGRGYTENQIRTIGYYPLCAQVDEAAITKTKAIFPGKKLVLVTTQTFLHDDFSNYISFLSADIFKHDLPYAILVKIHPSEKKESYSKLETLLNVRIVDQPIESLFASADLHVSIFSTTLYEALRFGLKNYSIWHKDYTDYIKWVEESRISTVIQPNENPILQNGTSIDPPATDYFFEPFHKELL